MPETTWSRKCHTGIIPRMAEHYIKEWREFRGYTQDQAAELSGISQSVLARIESGAREYKEHHLTALAGAFMCETWELLGKNPTAAEAPPSDIESIWDHIPASNREQARRILETFADKKKA